MARTSTSLPRTHYRTATKSTELPFVSVQKQADGSSPICFWAVDSIDDYCEGCNLGREYAAHYLQYLNDNLSASIGTPLPLTWIVRHIDFNNPQKKGTWIGFISFLEKILIDRIRTIDVYATLDELNASYAATRARVAEYNRITELEEKKRGKKH